MMTIIITSTKMKPIIIPAIVPSLNTKIREEI